MDTGGAFPSAALIGAERRGRPGSTAALLAAGPLAFVALVAGCVTAVDGTPDSPVRPERDSAPAAPPPGLAHLPDPEVRTDPLSRYGNRAYEVFGQRYEVLESAVGYDESGVASWYGQKFHGHPTSSGEIYNMYRLTAAHKTLPIPSYARVTNRDNGKTTIVRINDRGPFRDSRIIDLSYASAVKLGFADSGTARVRVESLLPGDVATSGGRKPSFYVHAGPFAQRENADAVRSELASVAAGDATVVRLDEAFAVRIGPLASRWDAERLRALLVFREQAGSEELEYIEE